MTDLVKFTQMLDSQKIVYKRYRHKDTIEIAMPCNDGWHCFDFDFDGKFESVWDRDYDYGYSQYDPEFDN